MPWEIWAIMYIITIGSIMASLVLVTPFVELKIKLSKTLPAKVGPAEFSSFVADVSRTDDRHEYPAGGQKVSTGSINHQYGTSDNRHEYPAGGPKENTKVGPPEWLPFVVDVSRLGDLNTYPPGVPKVSAVKIIHEYEGTSDSQQPTYPPGRP